MPKNRNHESAVRLAVHDVIEQKTEAARHATTLEAALDGMALVPIPGEMFAAHRNFYVVLNADGSPYVRDSSCSVHGTDHRVMPTYTTKEDVDTYMTSYEPQMLLDFNGWHVHPSDKLDGNQVLALAETAGAEVLDINWLGASQHQGKIQIATLAQCRVYD